MQPQQHNQPRGCFAPGGNRNGTSPTFVRMASALISYNYASAILDHPRYASQLTVLLICCLHAVIIIAYISVTTSALILKEVSLLSPTNK